MQKIFMNNTEKKQAPPQKVGTKLIKYIIFTIAISWTPIVFNQIIAHFFNLEPKKLSLYFSEILFMTIILSSTNMKDISESKIDNDSMIFLIHIFINISNIVVCSILISIPSFAELSKEPIDNQIIINHFGYIIGMYVLAVFLGGGVQIACAIKEIIEKTKEGEING